MTNRTVLITGSNGGLGRAYVKAFAAAHYNVIAHARAEKPEFISWCAEVATENGVSVKPVYFDVTDESAIKDAVRDIALIKKIRIDVLINNAGIMHEALLPMMSMADARKQFDVNFFAPFLMIQLVSRFMSRAGGGVIINMSSRSGFDGITGGAVYGATKAAIASMSKSLAKELGRSNIRINCIAPGVIQTPMTENLSQQVKDTQAESTYVGRLGCPDDVAGLAVFLASDAAKYITGQVIRVDGGLN